MTATQPTPAAQPAPDASLAIERWSATSGSGRDSRASVVLRGGGHRWRAHADGNGAVDALMRAVDRALESLLGSGVELATYEVHATGPGHDTAGAVAISLRPRGDEDAPLYPGRGVHDNILEASLVAYVEGLSRLLADRGVDLAAAPAVAAASDRASDTDARDRARERLMSAYNG
jgi:LeuA allosteric (dimerisation) domain